VATVLTRDAIRVLDDQKIDQVMLPEWGEDVCLYVRSLTGKQRDDFELSMIKGKGKNSEINLRNLRARLIVLTAVDSDNPVEAKLVFTRADESWLGDKNAAPLQRLYAKAQDLSGLTAEDVDDLTSELGNDLSDGSGSDSPDILDTLPSLQPSNQ
jgi:hypothetical protein